MVSATQLRPGMAIRYEGQVYKVLSSEYHAGQGKMGGVTHVSLRNLSTGTSCGTQFPGGAEARRGSMISAR